MKVLFSFFIVLSSASLSIGQVSFTFDTLIDYQGNGEFTRGSTLLEDGSIVVSGVTNNQSVQGIAIVKLNNFGEIIFKKAYYHPFTYFYQNAILQTHDGGFMVCGSVDWAQGDAMFFKFNKSGDSLWIEHYGTAQFDVALDCAQTENGDFVGVGVTSGFGANPYDIYVFKADSLGNEIWERNFRKRPLNMGAFLTLTVDGGFISNGVVSNGLDSNDRDAYLIKHDSLGNIEWDSIYDYSSGTDCADHTIINDIGNYFQRGCTDTIINPGDWSSTSRIQEMTPEGQILWRKFFNRPYYLAIWRAIQSRDGGYVLVGSIDPENDFHNAGWICKTTRYGEILWERTYKTLEDRDDYFTDIHESPDHGLVVTGSGFSEPSHSDLWVLKLDSMGCLEPGCDTLYNNIMPTQSQSEPNIVHVFPNPFYSSATVVISLSVDERRGLSFTLYDVMGAFVQPIPIPESESDVGGDMMFTIKRTGLSAGVYIYSLENNNGLVYSGKLLVR